MKLSPFRSVLALFVTPAVVGLSLLAYEIGRLTQLLQGSAYASSSSSVAACVPLLASRTIGVGWANATTASNNRKHSSKNADEQENHEEPSYYWNVPEEAMEKCNLASTKIYPLQSTPESIAQTVRGKWILFTGDSSTRMLYDYFVGRLVGGYTHWPSQYNNHGPPHSLSSQQGAPDNWYDFWYEGTRLSFVWTAHTMTNVQQQFMHRTVGRPDFAFAQHGYWDEREKTYISNEFVQYLNKVLAYEELAEDYPLAYNNEKKTYKIWLTMFQDTAVNQEGVKYAKQANWTVLDRTALVEPTTGAVSGPHPMNEVLEISLELVLAAINCEPMRR
jgi:hypothetical protein